MSIPKLRIVLIGVALAVSAVVVFGARDPAGPALAASNTVQMQDFFFVPVSITITVGDTVRWENNGGASHTATNGPRGAPEGSQWLNPDVVNSGNISPSVTFNSVGVFPYHCRFHPGMDGTLTVEAPTATPTPEPTPTPGPPTPTPKPTQTPTPTPQITVTAAEEVKTVEAADGAVALLQPTESGVVSLPETGLALTVPAFAYLADGPGPHRDRRADTLPLAVGENVLRAFQIDVFDEKADPLDGGRLGLQATLRLTLSDAEVGELGGLAAVFEDYVAGRIGLRRLSESGTSWTNVPVTFDSRTRTFTARLSRFSTFALVRIQALEVASPTPSAQSSVTLQANKDNTLFEDETGSLSSGAGAYLFVGQTRSGSVRRGAIAFDVASAIPAGSSIVDVVLTLSMSRTSGGPETVLLHRLLTDWGEGTSVATGGGGSPSTGGDATWIHTHHDTATWDAPGGDFVSDPSAATEVGGVGTYTWTSESLVADVRRWLDSPATNFGWALLGNEERSQTTKRFDSRETEALEDRPVLQIEYTPPNGQSAAQTGAAPSTGDATIPSWAVVTLAILGAALLLSGARRLRGGEDLDRS